MKTVSWTAFLRNALNSSGKTAYQLSKDSGISQMTVGEFMDGKRDIRLATAEALAKAVKFYDFSWVLHLLKSIDEVPDYVIKTAWGSIDNSLDVGLQRGLFPKRVPRLRTTEEKIDHLVESKLLSKAEVKRMREMKATNDEVRDGHFDMTNEQVEEYVAESYGFVQRLWNMGG